jgi:hypothetical protein
VICRSCTLLITQPPLLRLRVFAESDWGRGGYRLEGSDEGSERKATMVVGLTVVTFFRYRGCSMAGGWLSDGQRGGGSVTSATGGWLVVARAGGAARGRSGGPIAWGQAGRWMVRRRRDHTIP